MCKLHLSTLKYTGVHRFVDLSNRKCDIGRFPSDSVLGNYQPESYFYVLQNKEIRKQLTKFRISNHKLMIETGRYQRSKIPADVRFCPVCAASEIENEEHFIINCKKYEHVREKFLDEIKLVTNSKTILNNGSLRSQMTSTNPKIVKLFSYFLFQCVLIRNSTLS